MAERRPLRIGVDGRELVGRPTGVGRYLSALLGEWSRDSSPPHEYTVFLPGPPPGDLATLGPRVRWSVIPARSAGTVWEQWHLPNAVRAADVDVFFAAGYTAPLRLAVPFVVAIYDVSFWAHPEWFGGREGLRRRWLTRAAARRARRVITISEFSAGEIVRYLGIVREKITLAEPGGPEPGSPGSQDRRGPGVLFVGSLFARRRIPELLEAFGLVRQQVPDARLVLVGDNRTLPPVDPRAEAERLGIGAATTWHEYVDDAALERIYGDASVFVFLSEYEGFAMTPFEAIARGAAAVLLDTPVAREVYGEAARLVHLDPRAIAGAIAELLVDPRKHAALLAAGRRRLDRLSWARSAAIVRRALEDAAAPA
jgi:glycosyltransferase involved in cell wall biosynthesis